MFKVLATAVVTAVLTSAFWIFFYNLTAVPAAQEAGKVSPAGQKMTVDPRAQPPVTIAEGATVGPAGLAVPVQGVKPEHLSDTFTQARAGGARRHDAIDIMAPQGTPVVSASDGTVEKLFFSEGGGGISVYVRSPDTRWIYYYAHLQRYASGLAEGQKVRRGQLLGYVGATGNANPVGPHLHFAINRMEPGEKWWQGTPINPYPLLAAKGASG